MYITKDYYKIIKGTEIYYAFKNANGLYETKKDKLNDRIIAAFYGKIYLLEKRCLAWFRRKNLMIEMKRK